jgi:hypothetical protein
MPTFSLIQSITVSGNSTNSVVFNSIPQSFTDLIIYTSARSLFSSDSDNMNIKYNSITSYSGWRFYADGGSLVNNTYTTGIPALIIGNNTGNTDDFSHNRIQIYDYTNSTNVKTASSWGGYVWQTSGTTYAKNGWHYVKPSAGQSTAAITSLTLDLSSGSNFHPDSTFYLYGIKNT